jgi:hypothetical protein
VSERCGAKRLMEDGIAGPCELFAGHAGDHRGLWDGRHPAEWSGGAEPATPAVTPEPAPVKTDSPAVWLLVIDDVKSALVLEESPQRVRARLLTDMCARDAEGRRKYGVPLQVENGRNPAVDAYQEALDLTVYARQQWERHHTRAWWTIYEDALKLAARICWWLKEEGR